MVHDPASWFDDRISPVEQGVAAEKLAEAVLRWYSAEFDSARTALEGIYDVEGRPRALLCAGQMMHAHHGLSLWLEDSKASALGPAPVVAERIVALAHGLPEAHLAARARTKSSPSWVWRAMPSKSVPSSAARREAHVLDGLVAEQLQHHELVQPAAAPCARASAQRVRLQLGVGHRPRGSARSRAAVARRDLVAGQQVALRPLEPHPVDPHRGGRRAPDARRADSRSVAPSPATIRSAHSTMSVPPPMHQPCTAAIVGFRAYQSFM